MNELDICTICNNKDIEPTVCISCWSSNYEKGALEELKKIRFKLETCCGIEKLYVYTQTRIKELGE